MSSIKNLTKVACLVAALVALGASTPTAYAQYHSGSTGVNGVFPPIPDGLTALPDNAIYVVWNISTGLVRYCAAGGYDAGGQPETCTGELATAQIPGIPPGGLTTGVYNFTDFDVQLQPVNVFGTLNIYVVGDASNVPLSILSQNNVRLGAGVSLYLDGVAGKTAAQVWSPGAGGRGGPGGFPGGAGGNGGDLPSNGNPGFGPAGGAGGVSTGVTRDDLFGKPAGASPATLSLTPLVSGSGGGGGAGVQSDNPIGCGTNSFGFGGGGGGGGGGAVLLAAENTVEITSPATVSVRGGSGTSGGCSYLYGAGGEAGSIRIVGRTFTGNGTLSLYGGYHPYYNSYATGGRLRIEAFANTFTGSVGGLRQGSFIAFPLAPVPADLPTLKITSVAGVAVPADARNDLQNVDVNFPTAPVNPASVALSGHGIPLDTTATVRVTPTIGAVNSSTSTGFAGTIAASTASAQVTIPAGYGSINAVATWAASLASLKAMGIRSVPSIDGDAPERMEVVAKAGAPSHVYVVTNKGRRYSIEPSGEVKLQ